ncbi:flagellar biosynthesis chaperone [Fictibacillus macauensis ZFHKF-1]|uniref:Flagellar FliJ protein n=1 Tax=Fictibacillus macauensis ZFHKF-1 TaxID=1196324 RepID=I8AI07_9BACL|nr:flagellar export protein FliJ [Fictibacillus macauensis]EIT85084.1 flagellar biosynthesis chaperone [Fictibacillus macauensis ZFHKF-1]
MIFEFKMEKLLRLKIREKEQAEVSYAASVDRFEELAQTLFQLLKQRERIEEHSSHQFRQKVVINELQQTQRFLLSLSQRIADLHERVLHARREMNEAQQWLVEKTTDVKKLEKLKEKREEVHKEHIRLYEMKESDEVAVRRYINV